MSAVSALLEPPDEHVPVDGVLEHVRVVAPVGQQRLLLERLDLDLPRRPWSRRPCRRAAPRSTKGR